MLQQFTLEVASARSRRQPTSLDILCGVSQRLGTTRSLVGRVRARSGRNLTRQASAAHVSHCQVTFVKSCFMMSSVIVHDRVARGPAGRAVEERSDALFIPETRTTLLTPVSHRHNPTHGFPSMRRPDASTTPTWVYSTQRRRYQLLRSSKARR
jgi:hypothetical protein